MKKGQLLQNERWYAEKQRRIDKQTRIREIREREHQKGKVRQTNKNERDKRDRALESDG